MASSSSEKTYGEIQENERYKRLSRELKLAQLKKAAKCGADNIYNNITWSNVSSINENNLDISSSAISLHFKNGSEIISSSTNMNKILYENQRKFSNDNNGNIATSSVKELLLVNDPTSRTHMPPPKSLGILAHSSKRNSPAFRLKQTKNAQPYTVAMQTDYGTSTSFYSSSKCPSPENIGNTSKIIFQKEVSHDNRENNIGFTTKSSRIFSKWRLMLNDRSQLIIKGTLECGSIARSKPVIRKLTTIRVQSVCNHIYVLNGNIYDEKNELPDYIRGKFFNGFPDDWENVYQVWRNFVQTGSPANFRWPTPVTDSDDGIQSDVTDIMPRKTVKKSRLRSKSSLKKVSCQPLITDRKRTLEKAFSRGPCQRSVANNTHNKITNVCKNVPKILSNDYNGNINESSVDLIHGEEFKTSIAATSSFELNTAITSLKNLLQHDKIDVILEKLNSKKFRIEFMDKIIQMYDSIKYILSYESDAETDTENVQSRNLSRTKSSLEKHHTLQKKFELSALKLEKENLSNQIAHLTNSEHKIRRLNSSNYKRSNESVRRNLKSRSIYRRAPVDGEKSMHMRMEELNDSENDDYIPKEVTLPQTLIDSQSRPQEYITPCTKHHKRANSMSVVSGASENYDSSVSVVTVECEIDKKHIPNSNYSENKISKTNLSLCHDLEQKKSNNYEYYDSSVSIIDDESLEVNRRKNERRRAVLQEPNIQCFQQVMKRTSLGIKHSLNNSNDSRSYKEKSVPRTLSKKCQDETKYQRKTSHNSFNRKLNLSDNKENQSIGARENRNEISLSCRDSHEIEMGQCNITEKDLSAKLTEKTGKPLVITMENTSINLNPELLKKLRSQKLTNPCWDFSNEHENSALTIERSRPSKLCDDRKRIENVQDISLIEDQQKPIPKSKSLIVELQDIKHSNMIKNKQTITENADEMKEEKSAYGSENNPKRLSAWVPKLLEKSDRTFGLVFEGKLLNELDHILSKKFTTDFILSRISLKIIKTESNEFYQLVGDLADVKHSVPKELQRMCATGCPSKIILFCEKWKELLMNNSNSSRHPLNMSNDGQNSSVSSHGRRILPPLCYWKGERITLKDNQAVYNPGNVLEGSFLSIEMSHKNDLHQSFKYKGTDGRGTLTSMRRSLCTRVHDKEKNIEGKKNEQNSNSNSGVSSARSLRERHTSKLTKSPGDTVGQRRRRRATSDRRSSREQQNPQSSDSTIDEDQFSQPNQKKSKIDNNIADSVNTKNEGQRKYKLKGRQSIQNNETELPSETPQTHGAITCRFRANINRDSGLSDDQVSNF